MKPHFTFEKFDLWPQFFCCTNMGPWSLHWVLLLGSWYIHVSLFFSWAFDSAMSYEQLKTAQGVPLFDDLAYCNMPWFPGHFLGDLHVIHWRIQKLFLNILLVFFFNFLCKIVLWLLIYNPLTMFLGPKFQYFFFSAEYFFFQLNRMWEMNLKLTGYFLSFFFLPKDASVLYLNHEDLTLRGNTVTTNEHHCHLQYVQVKK